MATFLRATVVRPEAGPGRAAGHGRICWWCGAASWARRRTHRPGDPWGRPSSGPALLRFRGAAVVGECRHVHGAARWEGAEHSHCPVAAAEPTRPRCGAGPSRCSASRRWCISRRTNGRWRGTWLHRRRFVLPLIFLAFCLYLAHSFSPVATWNGKSLVLGWSFVPWCVVAALVLLPRIQVLRLADHEKDWLEAESRARNARSVRGRWPSDRGGLDTAWNQYQSTTIARCPIATTRRYSNWAVRVSISGWERLRAGTVICEDLSNSWSILELLTGFVRERVPWTSASETRFDPNRRPPSDVQAVLTVVGRNLWTAADSRPSRDWGYYAFRINLSGTTFAARIWWIRSNCCGVPIFAALTWRVPIFRVRKHKGQYLGGPIWTERTYLALHCRARTCAALRSALRYSVVPCSLTPT